jgi:hypothetical protein
VCFSSVEELGHVCFRQWLEEEIDSQSLEVLERFKTASNVWHGYIKDCVSTFNPLELIIT